MSLSFEDIREWCKKELNFFRVHLLFFLLVPLISAGIFYGANGRFHIAFIDALFLCYSALTVTGLSTVNLSTLTAFQQVILYTLMLLGDVSIVAWVMVLIRKQYFVEHLESIKRQEKEKNKIRSRFSRYLPAALTTAMSSSSKRNTDDDIKIRVEEPSATLDPSQGIGAALVGGGSVGIGLGIVFSDAQPSGDTATPTRSDALTSGVAHLNGSSSHLAVGSPKSLTTSFEFVRQDEDQDACGIIADAHSFTSSPRSAMIQLPMSPVSHVFSPSSPGLVVPPTMRRRKGLPIPQRQTVIQPPIVPTADHNTFGQRGKDQGLGGFPGPVQLLQWTTKRYFPALDRFVRRVFTAPTMGWKNDKSFKWLHGEFSNLIINRNSDFDTEELDDEELERLGGLEYQALDFLSYLVIIYFVGVQLISIALIAPWLSTTHTYDSVFQSQPRLVNKPWCVVMGSYTGGGMSLVDSGMVPFQQAYLMIFAMLFAVLAGNHGLVSLTFWLSTKFVKEGSQEDRSLHFLLDHPRRCFIYLFPAHVTWFLLAALLFFTSIEWISFIVLDIGLPVTDNLPPGSRVVAGLFQSFAVRASGFSIVSLSSLAPSFQFLCIIMMYIAVYPVAMSIRSTNVYEERSLGVFEAEAPDEDEEPTLGENISRRERVWQYFGWHLRRQVAYDIWWLVAGIFLICVIERTKIMDDANAPWFNLFRILVFELVSAFGGIGLTLGIPTENYAFSGAFGPLSKLVVIVIMVRGRHRGLPVAIDRAILLPQDLVPSKREGEPICEPATSTQDINGKLPSAAAPEMITPLTGQVPQALHDTEMGQ
ncbi:TrkH-domain-containing protein [Trametopsis cervina]|nr:TrkH-domain-containing protein [Trametopsis cervina]